MAIERRNHEDFSNFNAFRCHLIGQAVDPDYIYNSNNIFFMSGCMHQMFDGLNCKFKKVPLIAIRFDKCSEVLDNIFGFSRRRAEIIIECYHSNAYTYVCKRIKDSYSVDEDKLEISTYVYPEDMADFIYCLSYKYEETKIIWENIKADVDSFLSNEEADELRTKASKMAQSNMKKKRNA